MIRVTEEMLATGLPIAQGEVLIWAKKYAPKELLKKLDGLKMIEMKLENDQLILGHSETGHHHVLECIKPKKHISKAAKALVDSTNDMFVDLKLLEECRLVHMRSNDNHQGFILPKGDYIRIIREEQIPEGWRRVQD